jgi:hypothetical protein
MRISQNEKPDVTLKRNLVNVCISYCSQSLIFFKICIPVQFLNSIFRLLDCF